MVERTCRVILSAYTRCDKNETNKTNEAKLDQSAYKEDEEGEGGGK
jgi:hypothetical protein